MCHLAIRSSASVAAAELVAGARPPQQQQEPAPAGAATGCSGVRLGLSALGRLLGAAGSSLGPEQLQDIMVMLSSLVRQVRVQCQGCMAAGGTTWA